MRKMIGNICYWLGDLVSKCDRFGDVEWFTNIWFPVYNRLMAWSYDLDPLSWKTIETDDE